MTQICRLPETFLMTPDCVTMCHSRIQILTTKRSKFELKNGRTNRLPQVTRHIIPIHMSHQCCPDAKNSVKSCFKSVQRSPKMAAPMVSTAGLLRNLAHSKQLVYRSYSQSRSQRVMSHDSHQSEA